MILKGWQWIHLKIGHSDSSPSDSRQGDMPFSATPTGHLRSDAWWYLGGPHKPSSNKSHQQNTQCICCRYDVCSPDTQCVKCTEFNSRSVVGFCGISSAIFLSPKCQIFNSSPPGRNRDRHFADDSFRSIFVNEKYIWKFWLKSHWSLFLRVQLRIAQHWFR